jgi:hypothetical protein
MPFFRVILSGAGISLPCEDGSAPAVVFYTTRDVHASSIEQAAKKATDLVLKQWLPGGCYAAANHGEVPTVTLDKSWQVSFLFGLLGRKPSGYVFYQND